jgi:hypothetical protein
VPRTLSERRVFHCRRPPPLPCSLRAPVCAVHCLQPAHHRPAGCCLSPQLQAIGNTYHPSCFRCTGCRKDFGDSSFYAKDNKPYCKPCYDENFREQCDVCRGPPPADKQVRSSASTLLSLARKCTPPASAVAVAPEFLAAGSSGMASAFATRVSALVLLFFCKQVYSSPRGSRSL